MSVNEEVLQPGSDSFWEVDCFKRTVKRQDDGFRLCQDLMQLIQDRAEIEKHYAKSLKTWSKKWHDSIEKGPEYGTTEAAWKSTLSEADSLADIHLAMKDKMLNEVQAEIKRWRSENFHKTMLSQTKEAKTLEDEFKKAQKPWAKRYLKVLDSKKKFHQACKMEKSATIQENNARGDNSVSGDQLKKVQEKADKCRRDVEATKEKYEATLNDLNAYNAKYMEDMTEVFNKSQEWEEKRLRFIKEMLYGIHSCLDLSQNNTVPQIYAQFRSTIDAADASQDLKWWSRSHGVDMPMNWPVFEVYVMEWHEISRKKSEGLPSSTVTLKKISQEKFHDEFGEFSTEFHSINRKEKKGVAGDAITITSIKKNDSPAATLQQSSRPQSQVYNNHASTAAPIAPPPAVQSQNPFGDDEWDDDDAKSADAFEATATTSKEVRALYDYDGQEDDELTFKVGEVFLQIKERDDQGWCTGQIHGRVGLFPDNYVEPTGN
ncbi:hypothetical protein CAPTEDRAFT_20646 [Capitella teleta]|uniref:F-BAR domain-containing protein n=1 Tax=Capitella teleta TaxID=283909 RepID=R7TDV9_CAPTE|nr:hypothetical protein CAPTEDRAFT_20646 [Capitella teleta]|eukprot:ELT91899.1 hypothetical protein CAPTEDRAFT_20646 [Capitella teleta]